MPRVIIVGGGIAGLSAAYDLARAGIECTLFEKRSRLGGVIETRRFEDCLLECGPDSFISAKPEALALARDLGLESEIIGSNDHQRTTYILKKGRLIAMPEGMMMFAPAKVMPMVKTPLLSWGTKLRMGLEMFRKPGARPGSAMDRSVADFVVDHFGRETLDYLAEPLLAGVYGGDPNQLSIASVLPRFLEMEAKYGSLARAAMQAKAPSGGGPIFRTLKSGLGTMVDALSRGLHVRHCGVEAIERNQAGFRVHAGGDWIEAGQVILACPAPSAAGLMGAIDGDLARDLSGIGYSSSAIVSLVYAASDFDGRRAGFGFLVPKCERRRLAACTFVNTKFSFRAPEDRIVLRCFLGGASDPEAVGESDETLLAIVRDELRRVLNLTAAPRFHAVARWPGSMAQYNVGHIKRVKSIRERTAAIPGLHLAGNAYDGIGIPDCVRLGRAAARKIIGE